MYNMRNTWSQNQTKVKKTHTNARNDNNRLFNEIGNIFA